MKKKQIRRSQTLSPFGVGAILDIDGESFVAADIRHWKDRGVSISEPRLENHLGVTSFRLAPALPQDSWSDDEFKYGVPFERFPHWMFCPKCRRMYWKRGRTAPVCNDGHPGIKLIPMRFVMACPNGHLADVPWDYWAHSSKGHVCAEPRLEFLTLSGGSGLQYLQVHCSACGAFRDLAGLATPDSLQRLKIKCPGSQPWQYNESEECDAIPQVIQRGATNLTFAQIESSIDIPPYSDWDESDSFVLDVINHSVASAVRSYIASGNLTLAKTICKTIAMDLGISQNKVFDILKQNVDEGSDVAGKAAPSLSNPDTLFREEYKAFLSSREDFHPKDRFIKRTVDLTDLRESSKDAISIIAHTLDDVVQVTRLREVRALKGFSRLAPPETITEDDALHGTFSTYSIGKIAPKVVPSDLGKLKRTEKWLPAVEVFGEGIFLTLNERHLQKWENTREVGDRAARLVDRRNDTARYLPEPSPRLLLLHTLAHLLIRQLSFECGYSISSLRERIYCALPSDEEVPMAGILIYTAAGDSEGTLGGLVREGEARRLVSTLLKAIQTAQWCSSDPLCRESTGQGLGALNLAACHACTLLPETSCAMSNRLLDRAMLLGTIDGSIPGFFLTLVDYLMSR